MFVIKIRIKCDQSLIYRPTTDTEFCKAEQYTRQQQRHNSVQWDGIPPNNRHRIL